MHIVLHNMADILMSLDENKIYEVLPSMYGNFRSVRNCVEICALSLNPPELNRQNGMSYNYKKWIKDNLFIDDNSVLFLYLFSASSYGKRPTYSNISDRILAYLNNGIPKDFLNEY